MIVAILIGIITSTIAEVVTALNKRLTGTVLQGQAAFLIALVLALIGGAVKVFFIDGTPLPTTYDYASLKALFPAFAEVWTVAQVYFMFVTKTLSLDVQAPPTKQTFAPAGGSSI
jgi:hypothetical protein